MTAPVATPVLVVGDLVTDVVAVAAGPLAEGTDTPAEISLSGGGSAANTAAWLGYAGVPVTLVAAVGEDPAGTALVTDLEAAGVRCAVSRHPARSGTVVVIADGAERTMLVDRGANAYLSRATIEAALPGVGHLHLSGYPLFDPDTRTAARHAVTAARAAGLTTSVDAASAGPLRGVGAAAFLDWVRPADLLFANLDEARVLVGEAEPAELARRLAGHVPSAIVKLGRDGAVFGSRLGTGAGESTGACRVVSGPAVPVEAVDVTGAGDAFAAGALLAWLGGAPPAEVLATATRYGALAVTRVGARPPRQEPGARPHERRDT